LGDNGREAITGTVLFILKNDKYRIDKAIKLKGKSKKIAIINGTVSIITQYHVPNIAHYHIACEKSW